MVISKEQALNYTKRILKARMNLLCQKGFFGLLLTQMKFTLDQATDTAYTDGVRIAFSPQFLDSISDRELEIVLLHEVMHIVLKHCFRKEKRDQFYFNIACDIVVNSNIYQECGKQLNAIFIQGMGTLMHKAPNGKEGYLYNAEEVYEMLIKKYPPSSNNQNGFDNNSQIDNQKNNHNNNQGKTKNGQETLDDHEHWPHANEEDLEDLWDRRLINAYNVVKNRANGNLPLFVERLIGELKNTKTDWRLLLNDFIQEDLNDYSLLPPDYRYEDSPFYLPSLSEPVDKVQNLLFMVDTSGSISLEQLTVSYSEIKGAIDQFDGRLEGYLGFFDAEVTPPIPFSSVTELKKIKPIGGGGTNFVVIFQYINEYLKDDLPTCVIILTDGMGVYPDESLTLGIPVLWLINNEEITPQFGKVARFDIKEALDEK